MAITYAKHCASLVTHISSQKRDLDPRQVAAVPLDVMLSRCDLALVQREMVVSGRLLWGKTLEPNPVGRMSGVFLPSFPVHGCGHQSAHSAAGQEGWSPESPSEHLLPPLVPPSHGATGSSCLCSHEVLI